MENHIRRDLPFSNYEIYLSYGISTAAESEKERDGKRHHNINVDYLSTNN